VWSERIKVAKLIKPNLTLGGQAPFRDVGVTRRLQRLLLTHVEERVYRKLDYGLGFQEKVLKIFEGMRVERTYKGC